MTYRSDQDNDGGFGGGGRAYGGGFNGGSNYNANIRLAHQGSAVRPKALMFTNEDQKQVFSVDV